MGIFSNSFVVILLTLVVASVIAFLSNYMTSKGNTKQKVSALIDKARAIQARKPKGAREALAADAKSSALLHAARFIANDDSEAIEKHTGHNINRLINKFDTALKRKIKKSNDKKRGTKTSLI